MQVLPNNIPPICINDPGLPLNLNSFLLLLQSFQQLTGQMLQIMFRNSNQLSLTFKCRNFTLRYTAPLSGNCPADYEEVEVVIYDIPNAILAQMMP